MYHFRWSMNFPIIQMYSCMHFHINTIPSENKNLFGSSEMAEVFRFIQISLQSVSYQWMGMSAWIDAKLHDWLLLLLIVWWFQLQRQQLNQLLSLKHPAGVCVCVCVCKERERSRRKYPPANKTYQGNGYSCCKIVGYVFILSTRWQIIAYLTEHDEMLVENVFKMWRWFLFFP